MQFELCRSVPQRQSNGASITATDLHLPASLCHTLSPSFACLYLSQAHYACIPRRIRYTSYTLGTMPHYRCSLPGCNLSVTSSAPYLANLPG